MDSSNKQASNVKAQISKVKRYSQNLEFEIHLTFGFWNLKLRFISVSRWIFFVPLPGGFNNRFQIREVGNPSQFLPNLFWTGHQPGGVPRPPWGIDGGNPSARYFSYRLNHLSYWKSTPVSQVINFRNSLLILTLECYLKFGFDIWGLMMREIHVRYLWNL